MTYKEWQATQYARDSGEAQNAKVIAAYKDGYQEALNTLIGLFRDLGMPGIERFNILARAIGSVEVDEQGRRLDGGI